MPKQAIWKDLGSNLGILLMPQRVRSLAQQYKPTKFFSSTRKASTFYIPVSLIVKQ